MTKVQMVMLHDSSSRRMSRKKKMRQRILNPTQNCFPSTERAHKSIDERFQPVDVGNAKCFLRKEKQQWEREENQDQGQSRNELKNMQATQVTLVGVDPPSVERSVWCGNGDVGEDIYGCVRRRRVATLPI